MASGDIVPIELGLTDGDLVTLWAPAWREGDDEWEAFLGHGDDLYGFESIAELAAFVRSNADNDLVDHPAWRTVTALSATEFEPDESAAFDLIAVPELAASDPDPDVVEELDQTLSMVRTIGEVCELEAVTKFFGANPVLSMVSAGVRVFDGRDGLELWDRIGTAIAKDWDGVLDAIDEVITVPDVDSAAVDVAEAELVAAAENIVEADDDADSDDEAEFETVDLAAAGTAVAGSGAAAEDDEADDEDDEDEDETFWSEVGIDPIKIITSDRIWFTLRCYLDDDPVFLGRKDAIFVFASERSLARYLADDHEHDLVRVSTFADVQALAVDGSLEVEITDENIYVLPGLADDLAEGPAAVDMGQLDLAVELLTDAADYVGDEETSNALASSTPLGWYVSYLLNPDPNRMAPSPPFAAEAESWRGLVREFETRLRQV
ncbi:primosomal protein [Aldersonia sp. NBC_00410]|uniref:primosomal protein n=1 Tax=Aldersonia sp. NBC_00410 TaxID=2975954 RepID=UPI002256621F|nr:primosomal protein [Aldersonia sp. NBC_00410]MCX5044471.1 primosomal protein [Aldersonia sp. NBC_00410]